MLSEEERMAIEHLKNYPINWLIETVNESAIKIILNLIEKDSKEIEELKENNKNLEDELNKYIVKMSDEQYRRLVDIIRDEINKLWEDKIKAKIEEIDKKIYEYKKWKELGTETDVDYYDYIGMEIAKTFMQSLLYKED